MELSRHSPAPARYTGIGLVVAVHLVAITALSVAFVKPGPKPVGPIELVPLPRTPEPPPPLVEPLKAARPVLAPIPDLPIPVPQEPAIAAEPLQRDLIPTSTAPTNGPVARGTPAAQPALPATRPLVLAPGAVCSVMPRPEVPVLSWAGEAVLQAVATVRGGRVVGSELRVLQGTLDPKVRRALQRSVEAALAGYQCQGDATFQQDFAFRLD